MNFSLTTGGGAMQAVLEDGINFSDGTFKCLLMRSGFSFSTTKHVTKKNVFATSASAALTITAAGGTIVRGTGDFVTDGFVVGNYVTTTGPLNPGPFQVTAVASGTLTVQNITGEAALVDESVTGTVSTADEFPATGGYTSDTATITFTAIDGDLYLDTFDESGDYGTANLYEAAGIIVYCDSDPDDTIVLYARTVPLKVNL